MTEQAAAKKAEEPKKKETLKMPTTQEVKQRLKHNIFSQYYTLIKNIKSVPFDDKLCGYALQNLDQGMMWVDQAISALDFDVVPPGKPETDNEKSGQDGTLTENTKPEGEA